MREIKFRAWDTQRKEMKMPSPNMLIESFSGIPFWQFGFDPVEPMNWIVMQFTGLCDKKGKEIYEGDIVELDIHYNRTQLEVLFWRGGFQLKSSDGTLRPVSVWIDMRDNPEVIGNIWENSELLKV